MYEKEFDRFGYILGENDLIETCMGSPDYNGYGGYIDTIISFDGTKEDLVDISSQYSEMFKEIAASDISFRDKILTDEQGRARHDLELSDTVDFDKVISSLSNDNIELNEYELRAKKFMLLESARLLETYGADALAFDEARVRKEVRLGAYPEMYSPYASDETKEKYTKRIELADTYGEACVNYIENYELLKTRVNVLLETATPEERQALQSVLTNFANIDQMLASKSGDIYPHLKQAFDTYELANRTMLEARLNKDGAETINNPEDGRLMIVHFVPDHNNQHDQRQNEHFETEINNWIHETIEAKYGRPFDESLDAAEAQDLREQYIYSRENPCDLDSRIPLKCRYTKHLGTDVITKPTTSLSCSIASVDAMKPHLGRNIAIGFSEVPADAIHSVNRGYNNALDEFDFERNSVPFTEALEGTKNGRTNETLLDWSKVKPSYIMVMKNGEEIDPDTLATAKRYAEDLGLPLKIFDAYELERAKSAPTIEDDAPIEGAFSSKEFAEFAYAPHEPTMMDKVKSFFRNHFIKKGGPENEQRV